MTRFSAGRLLGCLLLTALLAGCDHGLLSDTTPPDYDALKFAQTRKSAAIKTAADCFHAAAMRLDDGTSDAAVVAVRVERACSEEWDRSMVYEADEMDFKFGPIFLAKMSPHELEFATSIVLAERARKKANP